MGAVSQITSGISNAVNNTANAISGALGTDGGNKGILQGSLQGTSDAVSNLGKEVAKSPLATAAITAVGAANGIPPWMTAAALGVNRTAQDGNIGAGLMTGVGSYMGGKAVNNFIGADSMGGALAYGGKALAGEAAKQSLKTVGTGAIGLGLLAAGAGGGSGSGSGGGGTVTSTGLNVDGGNYAKQSYLDAIPQLNFSIDAGKEMYAQQGQTAMQQALQSKELALRRAKFNTMEDSYAQDAMGWDSDARKESAASRAMADVQSNLNGQREQASRAALRMGVNPNSGKFAALQGTMDLEAAKASTQAANKARQDIAAEADAKKRAAIAMGSNLSTQATQAAQAASYAGNAATNTAAQGLTDRLRYSQGLSGVYNGEVANNQWLWNRSNLTAAQQAEVARADAATQAQRDSNLWGAAGSVLGSPTAMSGISSVIGGIGSLIPDSWAWDFLGGL